MTETGWTWTYDALPYTGRAIPRTNPDLLATLATLAGLRPAPIETARVLELGCADGGNLIPMAYALPKARFVGVDASKRQIEHGGDALTTLGLHNVDLRTADLTTLDDAIGQFDYVIAHGLYSWVSSPIQERMLTVIRERLAPQGVAFVSYNALPGFHMRQTVRDFMVYHGRRYQDLRERTAHARALLEFFVETVPPANAAYHGVLEHVHGDVTKLTDAHLFHDLLEESNHPLYFHEFVTRAQAAGLGYVTDAEFWTTQLATVPEAVAKVLTSLAPDPVDREQYLDFWRNRAFRQSLLCHANVPVRRSLEHADATGLLVAAELTPAERADDEPAGVERFANRHGVTIATDNVVAQAAFRLLAEIYPRALPFRTLLHDARARAGRTGGSLEEDGMALHRTVLSCFATDVVELHTFQPSFATDVGDRPVASAVARHQLATGGRIASLLHRTVEMDDPIALALLQHLDGAHDRAALHAMLMRMATEGALVIKEGPDPVTDPARLARILAEAMERHLQRLARYALLVA